MNVLGNSKAVNHKMGDRKASAGLAALALGVASLFSAVALPQEAQQGTQPFGLTHLAICVGVKSIDISLAEFRSRSAPSARDA